ncbi:Uncharacterized conserved protein [Agrococcus baldri]|uniref:Uncharacterized conserved protein n=1 Tax=Agrococcus baldri TaxID=153730 RepID=A0AA94HKV6_9MICO|nr:YciI family protein [Agrococcus baldri]SFS02220.1 Uncharacterized conserved protein [Agrococcus baldri]
MQYMLIMRDEDAAAVERRDAPFEPMLEAMGRYNDALAEAGVFVTAHGLAKPGEGVVVDFTADPPLITDGPYGETKELFNGFWIIDTDSIGVAAEWAARAPLGPGTKLEIRRVHTEADLHR